MPNQPVTFANTFFISFENADPAGIVYFANHFHFTHLCLEEFLHSKDLWSAWFANPELAAPIKATSAEYEKPLYAGDPCQVTLTVKKVGDTSVAFQFQITDKKNDLCARLESVHVFISKQDGSKQPVPEKIKAVLS